MQGNCKVMILTIWAIKFDMQGNKFMQGKYMQGMLMLGRAKAYVGHLYSYDFNNSGQKMGMQGKNFMQGKRHVG